MSKRFDLVLQKDNIPYPNLLDLQVSPFNRLFKPDTEANDRKKEDLYGIFKEHFPISDPKENYILEFKGYSIEDPIYSPEECLQKELTYSVGLKINLKLTSKEDGKSKIINETLFLGFIPYITPQGSFIINGKERVIVSQIHRSYGVFFAENTHLSGAKIFSAKMIPVKGGWIEFATDMHKTMYVYIDRKKKLPITLLLRALGYGTDKDIFKLFQLGKEIKVNLKSLTQHKGTKLAGKLVKTNVQEFVDPETGEVISIPRTEILLKQGTVIEDSNIQTILESEDKTITIQKEDKKSNKHTIIDNSLSKDQTNSEQEAIEEVYKQIRSTDPPDEETAKEFIHQYFFNAQRIFLGKVCRYTINKKLKLDIPENIHTLTKEDIIQIIQHFFDFIDGKVSSDDIDHLSSRRVRVGAEQLFDVINTAISRMARIIKERISIRANEEFKLMEVVTTRILSSAINSFFATHTHSQFMDQTNMLSELSHKRRLSSLGKGGVSRERAGFEVRDVHYTHYGRICPIETPDNLSIGLISSLAIHAKLDEMGFIQTPYKKITKGQIDTSGEIQYFTADEEEGKLIAQYTDKVDQKGNFIEKVLKVRQQSNFLLEVPEKVHLIDVSKEQITSVAAGLIPFLEHNDASRALMGANMQRQAIPLNNPQAPIVGTGLEKHIVKNSKILPEAEAEGTVTYVDASKIIITYHAEKLPPQTTTYQLKKLQATNQSTCINLKPLVRKGDHVKKGQILCEGYGTKNGELALGRNLNVAFMSYKGYNYEDAIVISEEVAELFTSLHIYEFLTEAVDTKLGPEKFTADIPNISESKLQNLDENGIIMVGKKVKPGDLLAGKVTPKAQTDLMPENLLLQAIFGEKAYNVKDTSLKVGPSFEGTIIDTQFFAKHERNKQNRELITKKINLLKKITNKDLADLKQKTLTPLIKLLKGEKTNGIYDKEQNIIIKQKETFTEQLLIEKIFSSKEKNTDLNAISIKHIKLSNWVQDPSKSQEAETLLKNYLKNYNTLIKNYKKEQFSIKVGDDLPFGILNRAKIRVAKKRKIQVGDKMAGKYGNKGVVAKILRKEDMPYHADGTPVDILLSPLGLPSRMNIGQLYEALLGLAGQKLGKKYRVKVFGAPGIDTIQEELRQANLPSFGLTTLYDGCTGEPFKEKITCGVTYMLKLNHLVDEKMHARSTGPYAIITQQPLGGRAQFGGQRIGEMESTALEAFGASEILHEFLTYKSDDIIGRKKALEAIVKGKNIPSSGVPEAFKIFIHELKGLCIQAKLKQAPKIQF